MLRHVLIGAAAVIVFLLVKEKLPLKQGGEKKTAEASAVEGAVKGAVAEEPRFPTGVQVYRGKPAIPAPSSWKADSHPAAPPPISEPPPGDGPFVPAPPVR